MYAFLHLEVRGQHAHVRLGRPDLHNAFNEAFIAEIRRALEVVGRRATLGLSNGREAADERLPHVIG
jgi:enoyl-CoA hydratase/carnithine racemase